MLKKKKCESLAMLRLNKYGLTNISQNTFMRNPPTAKARNESFI